MQIRLAVALTALCFSTILQVNPAHAQALCGQGFGTTGLEICVIVSSGSATPVVVQGTNPLPVGGVSGVPLIVGDYSVALTATHATSASGIELNVAGVVTRIGDSDPSSTNVVINAEAGRTSPLPGGVGVLSLSGASTGVGQVEQGGAAGSPFPIPNGDDLQLSGFPQIIQIPLSSAGAFQAELQSGTVPAGAVAIRSTTVVQINQIGDEIMIPGGTGGGDPPVFPMGTNRQITIEVDGANSGLPEHFPIEQFRRAGPDLCPDEHFHIRFGASPQSLEGDTFFDNGGCGAGEVDEVRHQTFAVLESSLSLSEDYALPDGEGFFIDELGTLTIPMGTTMTVPANSLLINQGILNVDGTLVIEAGGVFENNAAGVSNNASNTIDIFGTLTNRGTINNDGTITLYPGGTANDTGTINGNPIPEPGAGIAGLVAVGVLSVIAATRGRRE